jgi:serine/threonine protein kinase
MRPLDPNGPTDDAHARETDDGRRTPGERVPAVVGDRYTIRGVLGRGAMGVVYRAHDATLGRDVALKVLLDPAGPRADRRARLAREAQLQATLRHPGSSPGEVVGAPFVVFEFVEGARTLDQAWLEQPLARRVELLRDAARALGHAHVRGIVHRDVKPQNVLVDAEERVRVADFGRGAACVGTPLYMSPEQFSTGRAPVGPRADVWSLGMCLHEALTGTQPFQADHLVGLLQQIAVGAYTPAADAPAPLRDVVRRALQVDPARRRPDGEAFAAALDRDQPRAHPQQRRERSPRRLPISGETNGFRVALSAAR